MSKGIIRGVAIVAGVAALALPIVGQLGGITGVISAAKAIKVGAIAGAVSAVSSRLSQVKPIARGSITQTMIGIEAPRPCIWGRSYFGGILRYKRGYGPTIKKVKNPYLWDVKVFSGVTPVDGLESQLFDMEPIGSFHAGFYSSVSQLGLRPQPTAMVPPLEGNAPGWTANSKLSGCAAIGGNYLFDRKGKVFASGQPQHGAIWRGVKCYDSRFDSTRPGGVGPQRHDDYTTWVYTTNPAVAVGQYLLGWFEAGKLFHGIGADYDAIDWDAIDAWANDCDANMWNINGVTLEDGTPETKIKNLDDMCQAGGGQWFPSSGGWSFDWHHPRLPLATITDNDIVAEGGQLEPLQQPGDRFNTVVPAFTNEAAKWEQVSGNEIVGTTWVAEDGKKIVRQWPLNLVANSVSAGQIAAYAMADSRENGPITLNLGPQWRRFKPGQALRWQSATLGIDMIVVIKQQAFDYPNLTTRLVVRSETADKHPFALSKTAVAPATPIPGLITAERDEIAAVIAVNPTDLAALDDLAAAKLGGIAAGADVTGSNVAAGIIGQGLGATAPPADILNYDNASGLFIARPGGGFFQAPNSNQTGAIRIDLPVLWTNTMMRFQVEIFNFVTGASITYYISGYNYDATREWLRVSAQMIGPATMSRTVRFGSRGGKAAIWIGEPTSDWQYPNVRVLGFTAHFSNIGKAVWDDGWSIALDTVAAGNADGSGPVATIANPRAADAVFGTNTFEAVGGAVATLPNFKTPLGIAAGIADQGPGATAPAADVLNSALTPAISAARDAVAGSLPVQFSLADYAPTIFGGPLPASLVDVPNAAYQLDATERSVVVGPSAFQIGLRAYLPIVDGMIYEFQFPVEVMADGGGTSAWGFYRHLGADLALIASSSVLGGKTNLMAGSRATVRFRVGKGVAASLVDELVLANTHYIQVMPLLNRSATNAANNGLASMRFFGITGSVDFAALSPITRLTEDGVTAVTLPAFKTPLGIAAGITGQGPGATAPAADVLNSALVPAINDAATTAQWMSVSGRPVALSELDAAAAAKLGGIQDGADITAQSQVVITPPNSITIYRNSQGNPKVNQYPKIITPLVQRGGVSIRTDAAATYTITANGPVATVNNTAGSPDKGRITLTDGLGSISLTITVSGVAYGPFAIPVIAQDDPLPIAPPPPAGAPSGGGSDASLDGPNTTTYVKMTRSGAGESDFVVTLTGTGDTISASAPLIYEADFGSAAALTAYWAYRTAGSGGAWLPFDAAITGTQSNFDFNHDLQIPGNGNYYQTKTGLAASNYEIALIGRSTAAFVPIYINSGSATVSVS